MNEITTVLNTFVYKRHKLTEKTLKESSANSVLTKLVPAHIPVVINTWDNLCVMEFVDGVNGCDVQDKTKVSLAIAKIVADIYNLYTPLPKAHPNSWNASLKQLTKELKQLKPVVGENKTNKLIGKLLRDLEEIAQKTKNYAKLTFVHRDLHLGNVILTEKGCTLIDFEHAMEAPIELEFQNSIFWHDEKSLNLQLVRSTLSKNKVRYSLELENLLLSYYIADQLVIANKEGDMGKFEYILNKCLW